MYLLLHDTTLGRVPLESAGGGGRCKKTLYIVAQNKEIHRSCGVQIIKIYVSPTSRGDTPLYDSHVRVPMYQCPMYVYLCTYVHVQDLPLPQFAQLSVAQSPSVAARRRDPKGACRRQSSTRETFGYSTPIRIAAWNCGGLSNVTMSICKDGVLQTAESRFGDVPDLNIDKALKNRKE